MERDNEEAEGKIDELQRSRDELQQTVEADNLEIGELQRSRDELQRLNFELQVKLIN